MAVRKARAMAQSLIELKQDAGINIPKFNYSAAITTSAKIVANHLRKEWNLNEIRSFENINEILKA